MVRVIVLVGSSSGFGKALVEEILNSDELTSGNEKTFVALFTTSKERTIGIWNTAYELSRGKHFADDTSTNIEVIVEQVDLAKSSDCQRATEVLSLLFSHIHSPISSLYLFLNSGSVKPVGPILDLGSGEHGTTPAEIAYETQLREHCSLNFISFALILKRFVRLAVSHSLSGPMWRLRVVNVSSLAALQPLFGMSAYCAIKASRDSLLGVLAKELAEQVPTRDIKLLSYAPGPMRTLLVTEHLMAEDCPRNALKAYKGDFVDPNESAKKCIHLLVANDVQSHWSSGDHVDFFISLGPPNVP
jgi:NAD(P)-dependent dehydrogenase (short-subunit alcohol dehydrogenase family)